MFPMQFFGTKFFYRSIGEKNNTQLRGKGKGKLWELIQVTQFMA